MYCGTGYDVRMHQHTRGGARLKAWLKAQGKTQEWLAAKLGTHQTNVSAWILGRVVPLEMALGIRRITKIPVEDWVVPVPAKRSKAIAASPIDEPAEPRAEAS